MTRFGWNRTGGVAGIAYVLIAAVTPALTGQPPGGEASSAAVRTFFIDHRGSVVAQGWLYALATIFIVWFALAVRRVLYTSPTGRHLSDMFFVATVAVATLSFVSMSIRIVAAGAADELSPSAVRAIGADFSLVLLALSGFMVAVAAIAYAACVLEQGVLARWTVWLAVIAAVVNLAGTASVFIPNGPFAVEGGLSTWFPVVVTAVWYLGTSISLYSAQETARLG
ncbi:hypothetical protein AB4Z42_01925 [Mycobacterium sp. 2YAF39]|uniref:hypothetical protein n=1 Tax=Mycobacterium sp. 2YAF39 TaxID=3233033 RepID=UPI003F9DBCD4